MQRGKAECTGGGFELHPLTSTPADDREAVFRVFRGVMAMGKMKR
jgi:hypothetical protein